MRVFIADDESLIRKSLKSMLQEMKVPIKLVGEAVNGEEMVQKISELQPDLAFVDIRMPKLNGLEAIKIVKTVSPHTQWVILTGFSEFDYAKEAIQLGTANYLLKPVSPEDLEKVLQELFEKHKDNLIRYNQEFKNEIVSLYHGFRSIDELENKEVNSNRMLKCAIFYMDSHLDSQKEEYIKQFFLSLEKKTDLLLLPSIRNALFSLPNGAPISIVSIDCSKDPKGTDKIECYFQQLRDLVGCYENSKLSITMIESEACSSLYCIYQQIQDIQEDAHLRSILGCGEKWNITELKNYAQNEPFKRLSSLLIQLSNYYQEKLYLEFMQTLLELKKQFQKIKINKNEEISMKQFFLFSIGCLLEKGDMTQWIDQLEIYGNNLLLQHHQRQNQPNLVDQVISFIETQYMNDIGIGQIAEKLGVTPNYLSTLFRKKTGMTFMKYLTNVRILKAKELLVQPDMQVQQVAEKVGYYSARHFTKLFTEYVGCYPSEYRKKLGMNGK